jgi:DNA-binding NarL/FixJ family response regulator
VADGRSNREIGQQLFISDRTVARHLTNIFYKIGVTSRTQAARYALDRGLATSR